MSTELLIPALQKCSRCKESKPYSDFYFDGSRRYNLSSKCKHCVKVYNAEYKLKNAAAMKKRDAEYYIRNKEEIKARSAEWRLWNYAQYLVVASEYPCSPVTAGERRRKRRAAEKAVVVVLYTAEQFADRMSMWSGLCWICKVRPFEAVDHVKPISKGGPEMLSNLRPACTHCNCSKAAKWPFSVSPIFPLKVVI